MVIQMDKESYKKLVDEISPKENRLKNFLIAFFVGGLVGLTGQIIVWLLISCFGITNSDAFVYLCLIYIILGTLFTSLGFFDEWVSKCGAGLFLPTTGFAHSVQSSALDYKKDGLITGLGSNFFKLAGSVILYGIISSFFLVILKVIING